MGISGTTRPGGDFSIRNQDLGQVKETKKEKLTRFAAKLPLGGRMIARLIGTKSHYDYLKANSKGQSFSWDAEGKSIDRRDATQVKGTASPQQLRKAKMAANQLLNYKDMLFGVKEGTREGIGFIKGSINNEASPYGHRNASAAASMNYDGVHGRLRTDIVEDLASEMKKSSKDIDLSKFKDVDFNSLVQAWEQEAKDVRSASYSAQPFSNLSDDFKQDYKFQSGRIADQLDAGAQELRKIGDQIKPPPNQLD